MFSVPQKHLEMPSDISGVPETRISIRFRGKTKALFITISLLSINYHGLILTWKQQNYLK